jgi:S-DNA-T family DNA segregation ATPase FtsK/SpoIIIE
MAKRKAKAANRVSRKHQALGVLVFLLAAILVVSLATHSYSDDARITGQVDAHLNPFEVSYHNQAGMLGAYLSYFLLTLVGWLSYFLAAGLLVISLRLFSSEFARTVRVNTVVASGAGLLVTMLYNIHIVTSPTIGRDASIGGYIGRELTIVATKLIGSIGSYILLGGLLLVLLVLYTPVSGLLKVRLPSLKGIKLPRVSFSTTGLGARLKAALSIARIREWVASFTGSTQDEVEEEPARTEPVEQPQPPTSEDEPEADTDDTKSRKKTVLVKPAKQLQVKSVEYQYPGLELLNESDESGTAVGKDELEFTARMLRETLETFGVRVDGDIETLPGPVITRYEFKPAAGVKVNQIINLSDDLALALKAKRIRIVAPIPGKAAVGVEIPNRKAQTVYLRDLLETPAFRDANLRLPLALGKSISGKPYVADLTRMPHLLIAGATGSGKSVCMNVLISSLLYRLHPMQVRFIFIDPKMLELSVYKGIPHLGRPVVTKPRRAEKVLADAVNEMENRYRRLADASVRSIQDYNRKQKDPEKHLPYIIIFVDELADLMMSSTSSRTENLITRLAQMSRAVGIHLILATQRPSVDVITGLIKANFPARIAFQVSSKVDSRTILDCNGAEKLLGSGDMLFLNSGQPEPIRLHGPWVSGEETEALVKFIRDQGLEMMKLETITQGTGEPTDVEVDTGDPLFREACEVVVRHKQGSVSLLQRRLGIGYQRAARLIDRLEQAGIVSTFDGSKARDVLVDQAYVDAMFASQGASVGSDDQN